jgi:hypothetical protein
LELGCNESRDVDSMISWTEEVGDNVVRLIGFDKDMRELVNMIQTKNRWTIELDGRIIKVEGNHCNDPLRFVECLVSPNLVVNPTVSKHIVLEFKHGTGETWEVWNTGI